MPIAGGLKRTRIGTTEQRRSGRRGRYEVVDVKVCMRVPVCLVFEVYDMRDALEVATEFRIVRHIERRLAIFVYLSRVHMRLVVRII